MILIGDQNNVELPLREARVLRLEEELGRDYREGFALG